MSSDPQTIRLADYAVPPWLVRGVHLTFRLSPDATRVLSRIDFAPNPATEDRTFALDGEGPRLIRARIDGADVTPEVGTTGLTCDVPDRPFTWEAEVEIAPAANTALEGLYLSHGMYCTQCEAEGFRRITFYPDRPDVMAEFTVRIEGDAPVLLSNGNMTDRGEGWAEWHDPWPKPAYLFALVAGDLTAHRDTFTTMSGREVALAVWVRPGDADKCAFAMDALKRSMRWDEEVWGREYDLDIFNIVAVDDFNMGAMENKGLNIFNSAAVLASPETATDATYERIEAIVAHEYFHNWTGNRITCRDWFQLCLKEGLTVYRDQQFTADTRGHAMKRIEDAATLRARQFPEDAGPLAHPVRPESFVEINNFYTATVYEKGAEIIGMLRRLIGEDAWTRGLDLYFTRYDGQAVTIEDWLACFADAADRDLNQFSRWYLQAGTPHLRIDGAMDGDTLVLDLHQHTDPTPDQPDKAPQVIPFAFGLLHPDGTEIAPTRLIEMSETSQTLRIDLAPLCAAAGVTLARPVISANRGFAAPVIVDMAQSNEELALLLARDTDPFARWDAGHIFARRILMAMADGDAAPDPAYAPAIRAVLLDDTLDPAFRAAVLSLPADAGVAVALHNAGKVPDPLAIHRAAETLRLALAHALDDDLDGLIDAQRVDGDYRPDAGDIGRRSLGGALLGLVSRLDGGRRAADLFVSATNMTQSRAALSALLRVGKGADELATFGARWSDERLVMDQWFAMQVACSAPGDTVATAHRLTRHPAFDWRNPNRFRSVMGALAAHQAGFHDPSGAGYRLLADWLIRLDPVNPQTAARMIGAFETWSRWDESRQAMMRAELARIGSTDGLSRDSAEMVSRILG